MSRYSDYIFVLWGDKFEEVAATVFVTAFRQAGLRAKIVALTPRRPGGLHGLALVADMTLDQALRVANKAICVVVPYAASDIKHLNNDPRISEFFKRALANKAWFVVGQHYRADVVDLLLEGTKENVFIYPPKEYLVEFAEGVVEELAGIRYNSGVQPGRNNPQLR